jgi:DNA-binding response OmpR family regulator
MTAPLLYPKSILCVDADKASRELLQHALGAYRLTFACNAYEALRDIHSAYFDLYVIDQWLPDLGGVQLCREIRKLDPRAPVLFSSAAARDDSRKRAMRAGATVYLSKPLDAAALRNRVHDLLRMSEIESLHARIEEERVLQEELTRRAQQAIAMAEFSRDKAARAIERGARAKAFRAFVERGGTRASFERTWSQLFAQAWPSFEVDSRPSAQEPSRADQRVFSA